MADAKTMQKLVENYSQNDVDNRHIHDVAFSTHHGADGVKSLVQRVLDFGTELHELDDHDRRVVCEVLDRQFVKTNV